VDGGELTRNFLAFSFLGFLMSLFCERVPALGRSRPPPSRVFKTPAGCQRSVPRLSPPLSRLCDWGAGGSCQGARAVYGIKTFFLVRSFSSHGRKRFLPLVRGRFFRAAAGAKCGLMLLDTNNLKKTPLHRPPYVMFFLALLRWCMLDQA